MKERPDYSTVDDRLIVDSDADISPSQFQKAKAYMKIDKLNRNKWTKDYNINSSGKTKDDSLFSFRSNNEKEDLLSGTKWDKRKNLLKTNRSKGSGEKNYEGANRSETFNKNSKKNLTESKYIKSTDFKPMESPELKYLNKHLEKHSDEEKMVQPRLFQIDQYRKEIDIKPENKVDFVSALTELKATQEINVEDEDDSSTFRARQKFSFKKNKIVESSVHRKPKFFKKERELQEEEEGYFDRFDMDYELDKSKKKDQARQIKQKLQRETFIPDAISVSNLAKIIGVHLGEKYICF